MDNKKYSQKACNPGKVKIQSNAMNEDRTNENLKSNEVVEKNE